MNENPHEIDERLQDFPEDEMNIDEWTKKRDSKKHADDPLFKSIAKMEKALAKILEEEANVLSRFDHKDEKKVRKLIKSIENTLRKVILKEIVMILLMEEQAEQKKRDENDRKKKCHKDEKHCKKKGHTHDPVKKWEKDDDEILEKIHRFSLWDGEDSLHNKHGKEHKGKDRCDDYRHLHGKKGDHHHRDEECPCCSKCKCCRCSSCCQCTRCGCHRCY